MRFYKLLSAATAMLLSSVASAAVVTFSYTGNIQSYVVPAGVTSLHVSVWAGGGGGGQAAGNAGAYVTGDLDVSPGQEFAIIVGGGGAAGAGDGGMTGGPGGAGGFGGGGPGGHGGHVDGSPNAVGGGGGGGRSAIYLNSVAPINTRVVAGAGGGGGLEAGARPSLDHGDGSRPDGGRGGNGGNGGAGGIATPPAQNGPNGANGVGGGGAGGGFNGGQDGEDGANGAMGVPGFMSPPGYGSPGGYGINGSFAGSYFLPLTASAASAAPMGVAGAGAADPNYLATAAGAGGAALTAGQNGRVVIVVPEPTSIGMLAAGAGMMLRRRRSCDQA